MKSWIKQWTEKNVNADCEAGCGHEEVAKRIPNVRFIRTDLESVNPMMRLHSILRAAPF